MERLRHSVGQGIPVCMGRHKETITMVKKTEIKYWMLNKTEVRYIEDPVLRERGDIRSTKVLGQVPDFKKDVT